MLIVRAKEGIASRVVHCHQVEERSLVDIPCHGWDDQELREEEEEGEEI